MPDEPATSLAVPFFLPGFPLVPVVPGAAPVLAADPPFETAAVAPELSWQK